MKVDVQSLNKIAFEVEKHWVNTQNSTLVFSSSKHWRCLFQLIWIQLPELMWNGGWLNRNTLLNNFPWKPRAMKIELLNVLKLCNTYCRILYIYFSDTEQCSGWKNSIQQWCFQMLAYFCVSICVKYTDHTEDISNHKCRVEIYNFIWYMRNIFS